MSVAATVWDVEKGSCVSDSSLCWTVTVAVAPPSSWAPTGKLTFDLPGDWDTQPVQPGERVTVPVTSTYQHLVVHRASGDVRLKINGSVRDPNARLR